jgi:hypothetical protein
MNRLAQRANEYANETVQPPSRIIQQEQTRTMKRIITFVSAALLTGALATSAFAQSWHPNEPAPTTEYGEDHPYVQHFDNYLDRHPEVSEALRHNPSLINDPNYVSKHPELQEYLQHHPHVAAAFSKHPYAFMHREHRYERGENRIEHPGYGYVYDNNR